MTRRASWSLLAVALAVVAMGSAGCQDAQAPAMQMPPGPGWSGTLDVDIRDAVDVQLLDKGGDVIEATLKFKSSTYQPFDAAQSFRAAGRIERIPEAATELYVAKFAAPASERKPCAGQKMSLALSLARREKNARVGGGLTVYCGEGVWSGVPARILRLSGMLPANPQTP